MFASSGGFKVVRNQQNNQQERHNYVPTLVNHTMVVNFDILAPTHCHLNPAEIVNCTEDTPPFFTEEYSKVRLIV